ncbi:MAG: NlpC/P60 family protein [Myxococcota bacterium]
MDARTYMNRVTAIIAVVYSMGFGCEEGAQKGATPPRDPSCPVALKVDTPLSGVTEEQETLDYWLARSAAYGPLDEPLLGKDAIARHNLGLATPVDGKPLGQTDLLQPVDAPALAVQVDERLAYLRDQISDGTLVDADGDALTAEEREAFDGAWPLASRTWRRVEENKPLHCGPRVAGLFKAPVDPDFDRNLCSTMRPGELVHLLSQSRGGVVLARTPYALGWVDLDGLSAPLSEDAVIEASANEPLPMTRRAVLTEAFSMLGEPYGWGGRDGGYDCSRFLLELFRRFGVELPRHSARQALAGTFSIDVSGVSDRGDKRLLLEAAARHGATLMQFPGHIMLYLGTTEEGVPMAIHAFSEYLTRCDDGVNETVNRVDRIAVSDLSLGEGSSRGDFLDRVTRITVVGRPPGPGLIADAELRPVAPIAVPQGPCRDSQRHAIFRSPARPNTTQPLRVIATSERNPGIASLAVFGPNGERIDTVEHRLDGPPTSRFVEVETPAPGRYTAVLADGDRVLACHRFGVARRPPPRTPREPSAPAWQTTRSWNRAVENLYAAFIEQLFVEPDGEDATWTNLQEVIGDPSRNLLYDYRSPGEDARLSLRPDCADLPYFLRGYFAWKLGLPFSYRACTRGRKAPPTCEPVAFSNLDPEEAASDVGAFRTFIRRVGGVVHSSSPRTRPDEEYTDFYPVRLWRRALRPGTVFADPYGHVLVVARWKPQGVEDYGVLIGADAQPDGTVGRRRFWRGSFLFTPDTERVGAGFKGWRPVSFDEESLSVVQPTNEELRGAGPQAWSTAQYDGTADEFYAAVEGLINPRPLDPTRMQKSLVDALEESVQRRLNSVDNGEAFMRSQNHSPIDMPRGSALFLTSGPWEDYSTPSRDMRLLISVDAVTLFPRQVATHPARFGVASDAAEATAGQVQQVLDAELDKRTFEYTRSDGSAWQLSLADVVARSEAMEMAYNPNDCVEVRWGAPEGSDEFETCGRRAPADQQARMGTYRNWFSTRQRPE